MTSVFQRFVALRYLRGAQGREEGRRFLRFITYVAIGGVAVGVAALLLALTIVRGFSREIEAKIIGFGAHVQVESLQDAPLSKAASLQTTLEQMEPVAHVAPVLTEFILLRRSSAEIDGVALWGTEQFPSYLTDQLEAGSGTFEPDSAGLPGLVIGASLAQSLGVSVGDRLTAFSMRRLADGGDEGRAGFSRRPRVKQFSVRGIYETDLANFDDLYVFTDLQTSRNLLAYQPDQVTRLDVTLHDVDQAEMVADEIEDVLGFPILARSIKEVFRGLFAWVNLQESIIPLVIGVIIIVAAFNIVGTLLMIILEKTREIGVLASMGASGRSLRRLFLWLGLLIGAVGTGIGLVLALSLALLQQQYKIIPLPEEAYYMDAAPVALNPLDFFIVAILSLLLCALAAYIPARVASRIEPLKVIRFQ